jgi:hypothetical protein
LTSSLFLAAVLRFDQRISVRSCNAKISVSPLTIFGIFDTFLIEVDLAETNALEMAVQQL